MDKLLKNAKVFLHNRTLEQADVRISHGKIAEIGRFPLEKGEDLSGLWLLPGLIDIHTHGREGSDWEEATPAAAQTILRSQLRKGVTGVLATTVTQSKDAIEAMLENIAGAKVPDGAEILGVNLEGPFINAAACGAQPPEYCLHPDLALFDRFQKAARGMIRLVTVAPELPGAEDFIKNCGARVSAGHTMASYEQFTQALSWGVSSVTHLFNGMPPLHHRQPGTVGGALLSDCFTEIICDGIHIDPAVIRLAHRLKGSHRLIMVSDSMSGAGLSDGVYILGRNTVYVKDGIARIENGALAGSTASLSENMAHMLAWGFTPEEIIPLCTATPAALLGLPQKGILQEGADADLALMEPGFIPAGVFKAGERIF